MTRRPLPVNPSMEWPSRRTDIVHEVAFAADHLHRRWVSATDVGRLWGERWSVVTTARTGFLPGWSQRRGLMAQARRLTRRGYRHGLLDRARLGDVGLSRAAHPRSRWAYRVPVQPESGRQTVPGVSGR